MQTQEYKTIINLFIFYKLLKIRPLTYKTFENFLSDFLNYKIDQTSKQDILVVQGDWNAKVGEDAQEDWREVCARSCNPETNDRALKLLDFATYNNLVLANTLGNHKPSRRWT